MKMAFFLPAAAVIAICLFTGFAKTTDTEIVETLLTQRTEILQAALYDEITPQEAEALLGEIESRPLLTEDLESLVLFEDSDVDRVLQMNVSEISRTHRYSGNSVYESSIIWEMETGGTPYHVEADYYIVAEEKGNSYKLSQFVPLP